MAFTTESVFNSIRGAQGVFDDVNKGLPHNNKGEQEEVPDYDSTLDDEEILTTAKYWINRYENYIKEIEVWQKDNERYWLGKQYNPIEQAGTTKRATVDNAIFEALETFLPLATQTNPDPIVASDSSPEGQKLGDLIRQTISYQADRQLLRMKLKSQMRDWALYFTGVMKVYWDASIKDIVTDIIPPKRLILDPDACIDEKGKYHGEYIGEYKKVSGKELVRLFPSKKQEIMEKVGEGEENTRTYMIEWTTPTDLFWTLGTDIVLDKTKNVNWNWDGEVEVHNPEDPENPTKQFIQGKNHFKQPEINYLFLSVFNLHKQPHDETGLIYQAIPMQDVANERLIQIQQNVKKMNNGVSLNGLFFTKEQASQALSQWEKGGGIWVPNEQKAQGRLDEAMRSFDQKPLPSDVYRAYDSGRDRLTGIFGTSGSTPAGITDQKDVRGKIMAQQMDTSRIGGGITTYLEQVADTWYNWQLQMMYVWYDDEKLVAAIGESGAQQLVGIHNQMLDRPVVITVKEGSMVPKDPLTKRNEAVDLWGSGAIDPISLYKALEFPDPYNQAKQLLIWQMVSKGQVPPTMMFPDFQEQQQQMLPGAPGAQQTPGGAPASTQPVEQQTQQAQQPVSQASQQIMQSVPLQ